MQVYNYNSNLHKFKDLHDETGGKLKEFDFKYYDCFCGCPSYTIVSNATRHRNHFDIVQCSECGTLRINPYLSDASIERYYKEVYGPIKRQGVTGEGLFNRQSQNAGELFARIALHAPKGASVLDYGCGAGGRMVKFKAEGFDVSLQDFDRKYLEYGLSQGMKEFSESRTYDVIILRDVVEHTNHPLEFLRYIGKFLASGGKLYIEVPMIENNRTLLGDFQLAHKFYFTKESLTYLIELAGFKTVAESRNGLLISKGVPDIKMHPRLAKRKSDAELKKAKLKGQGVKFKMLFKKKRR